jgi:hypothetical protein
MLEPPLLRIVRFIPSYKPSKYVETGFSAAETNDAFSEIQARTAKEAHFQDAIVNIRRQCDETGNPNFVRSGTRPSILPFYERFRTVQVNKGVVA